MDNALESGQNAWREMTPAERLTFIDWMNRESHWYPVGSDGAIVTLYGTRHEFSG